MTVIPIFDDTLQTLPLAKKQEELKIRERIETIQTTSLLRSAKIFKKDFDS